MLLVLNMFRMHRLQADNDSVYYRNLSETQNQLSVNEKIYCELEEVGLYDVTIDVTIDFWFLVFCPGITYFI